MSYTKTTWVDGDIISAEKLNKIENGIVAAQESIPDIQNAGIISTTYTTIKDITVSTATSDTHDIPYAESEGGTIDNKYKYRVTVNETEYILDGRSFFKYVGGASGSGSKGVTLVGNAELYLGDNSGACFPIDSGVPFCLVEMDIEFQGIQIYTETPGEYSIKLERINYVKNEIPEVLIYGVNESPIYRKLSGGSYDGFSIGGANALIEARQNVAIGTGNTISGKNSVAVGLDNRVSGDLAIAVGNRSEAIGLHSFATGCATRASGESSYSEGETTVANGDYSHAEGYASRANAMCSHAENLNTTASGMNTHAEGNTTIASGSNSHAEGFRTTSNHKSQHVFGERNIPDPSSAPSTDRGNYVEIVGNGTANNALSNARTLDWDGNEVLAGKLTVGSAPTNDMDVATKKYVDDNTQAGLADVQINGTSIVNNGVANIPYASLTNVGVVKIEPNDGGHLGMSINSAGFAFLSPAQSDEIKVGEMYTRRPIIPSTQHESVFYGLAKASGDTTQSQSSNAVGTYTNAAKGAIKSMLGINVDDVQINGTSIVNNGIANIPIITDENVPGATMVNTGYGIKATSTGYLVTAKPTSSTIKTGTNTYQPLVPSVQHESTFYGLAKAAGDSTQSASSNAVGTYTDDAKIAIQKMLGIYEPPWELIYEGTTTEDLAELSITVDSNGEPFALSEMYSRMKTPAPLTGTTDYIKGGTYVKYSNGNNPGWGSLTSLRYTNASSIGVFEYMHKIVCGICQMQSKCGSGSSNSQNMQFASFLDPDSSVVVESINGIRWQQYNQTSTLIPSGTVVKIYGRRIPE